MYKENIYIFGRGMYSDDKSFLYIPKVSDAVKAHNEELSDDIKIELIEAIEKHPTIENILTNKKKTNESVSNYFKTHYAKVDEIKEGLINKRTGYMSTEISKKENWKFDSILKIERYNKPTRYSVCFNCFVDGLNLNSKSFAYTPDGTIKRLTASKKLEISNMPEVQEQLKEFVETCKPVITISNNYINCCINNSWSSFSV